MISLDVSLQPTTLARTAAALRCRIVLRASAAARVAERRKSSSGLVLEVALTGLAAVKERLVTSMKEVITITLSKSAAMLTLLNLKRDGTAARRVLWYDV